MTEPAKSQNFSGDELPQNAGATEEEASIAMADAKPDRLSSIRTKPKRSTLALMLHAGGDRRIWPDPVTGRNRYGTKAVPAPQEISFASTTASTISPASFEAVGDTYSRLFEVGHGPGLTIPGWFADIRARLVAAIGRPGDEVILAPSGTDAALTALAIARGLTKAPVTVVYFAPEETGTGIPNAAIGRHFSDMTALGTMVDSGHPIAGLGHDIETEIIPIRGAGSEPRTESDIDADVEARVTAAIANGRDVIITLLDTAKTGIGSMSRTLARSLAEKHPSSVHVIVDACQMRSPRSRLKADLEAGFILTITGSKYLAGPAFSGAVLVPKEKVETLRSMTALAPGLSDYAAALDWPDALRHLLGSDLKTASNMGLGFRWTAALEHLERLIEIDEAREQTILDRFAALARDLARYSLSASLNVDDLQRDRTSAVIALAVEGPEGLNRDPEVALKLHRELRENDNFGPVCHVGQPVQLEVAPVIRIAPSVLDIIETNARLDEGLSMDAALDPVRRRLETVFEKWNRLMLSGQ